MEAIMMGCLMPFMLPTQFTSGTKINNDGQNIVAILASLLHQAVSARLTKPVLLGVRPFFESSEPVSVLEQPNP